MDGGRQSHRRGTWRKTLRLKFRSNEEGKEFEFKGARATLPNIQLSVKANAHGLHCVRTYPKGYIECTFRKAGRVTGLDRLEEGMTMGVHCASWQFFPYRRLER